MIKYRNQCQILTPTISYCERYKQAIEAAMAQQNVFWPAEKMGVPADKADFMTKLTEGEFNAVLMLQTILTQYELMIGGTEMWGGKINKMFPRPEIQRMCACFSNVELGSHAPFYKEGNKVLNRDTDEFYEAWQEIPTLAKHVSYIESKAASNDPLEVTAALCFLEGVVLFAAFGFFKGFNANGFNLIPHFVSGIDASIKDENFHCMASAWLFQTAMAELKTNKVISKADEDAYDDLILQLGKEAIAHELAIIDILFEVAPETIRVVKKKDMQAFIYDRCDAVFDYLNKPYLKFNKPISPISEWVYEQVNAFKFSDFFASTQVAYQNSWDKSKLGYKNG